MPRVGPIPLSGHFDSEKCCGKRSVLKSRTTYIFRRNYCSAVLPLHLPPALYSSTECSRTLLSFKNLRAPRATTPLNQSSVRACAEEDENSSKITKERQGPQKGRLWLSLVQAHAALLVRYVPHRPDPEGRGRPAKSVAVCQR